MIQKDHLSQLNLHGNLGIHHHGAALLGNRVVVHQKLPEWRDWHNYTLMQIEKNQTGPGEQGKPVILESKEKLDAAYKGFKVKKFYYLLKLLLYKLTIIYILNKENV